MSPSRQDDPFAVSTPQPHPGAANLSPQERKIYEFLWNHRERAPSLGAMMAGKVLGWAYLAAMLAIPLVFLYTFQFFVGSSASADDPDLRPYFVAAAGGVLAGVVLRDYGYSKNVRTLWPIEAAVIDFAKVERLLWGESTQLPDREVPLAAIPVEDHSPRSVEARSLAEATRGFPE